MLSPLRSPYLERDPVLGAELLQLGHDAVCDVGDALGVEAVHHGLDHVQLVLHAEVDKVGVDEHVEGLEGREGVRRKNTCSDCCGARVCVTSC